MKYDYFDKLRAQASALDTQERLLFGMRQAQKKLILDASAAQMPARRIAEASRLTVGRIYQLRSEAKG